MTNQFLRGFLILGQTKDKPKRLWRKMEKEVKAKRNGFLEYASIVHSAKLEMKCKVLLWHYGFGYNWKKRGPSFYTQESICALTGMSPSTYQKARKRLLELGWIKEMKVGWDHPVLVVPKVGLDDPDYERHSWAKWHKDNRPSIQETLDSLPEEFRDPFGDSRSISN